MDHIDAQLLGHRPQDGDHDQLDHGGVDEHTQDQDHHVGQDQEAPLAVAQGQQPVADGDTQALLGEDEGDGGGGTDNDGHAAGALDGVKEDLFQLFPAHGLVDDGGNQDGVQTGDGTGLGGGGDAGVDAAQQDHGGQQGPDGLQQELEVGFQGNGLGPGIVPLPGDEDNVDAQEQSQQNAGDHAAHKQSAHGGTGEHGVNHHGDGGREDGADGGGGGGDGAGEGVVIALLLHDLDLHGADAGGVGNGGAGHAGEHQGAQHVHVGHAAPEPAHQAVTEAEDIVGDGGGVHQVGGEDEQRHGHNGAVCKDGFYGFLGDQMELARVAHDHISKAIALAQAVHQEVHGAGHDHAGGDGHTDDKHENEERHEDDQG